MSIQSAKNHFLGKDGYQKLNCAQAVLKAFQEPLNIPDGIIDSFSAFGGGRAPEGHCGAVYAAEFVLGMADITSNDVNALHMLASQAGSSKCLEIKAAKQLSCVGCVEACTAYVEQVLFEEMPSTEQCQ